MLRSGAAAEWSDIGTFQVLDDLPSANRLYAFVFVTADRAPQSKANRRAEKETFVFLLASPGQNTYPTMILVRCDASNSHFHLLHTLQCEQSNIEVADFCLPSHQFRPSLPKKSEVLSIIVQIAAELEIHRWIE